MSEIKRPSYKNLCVVDDDFTFGELLQMTLTEAGYNTLVFPSAVDFFNSKTFRENDFDLIVTDVNMPGLDGHDLCKRIRSQQGQERIPIIMLTGKDSDQEKVIGLKAGADDFIQKPFRPTDLLAKIQSLLEIKIQSAERMDRLTRFISPNIANLIVTEDYHIKPHRAQVTVMFIDLRGFTAFSENVEPEEVMEVLNHYYRAVGNAAIKYNATLGHLAGDGIMMFLNDPQPIEHHQVVGVQLALEIRETLNEQKKGWLEKGYHIDFGIGLAEGYATIGGIGFERFWQYSVIGPVANFASRICQVSVAGQILVSRRFLARTKSELFQIEPVGALSLKGLPKPVEAFNIISFTP